MKPGNKEQHGAALAQEFSSRLVAALEMLTGERIEAVLEPVSRFAEPADAEQSLLWSEFSLDLPISTSLWVAATAAAQSSLGSKVLLAAGVDAFEEADVAASYAEVIQSAISAVAQFIGGKLHRDVAAGMAQPGGPPPEGAGFQMTLRLAETVVKPIALVFPGTLIASLELPSQPTARPDVPSSATHLPKDSVAQAEPKESGSYPTHTGGSLERILDFELPLRVSFGKASIPLSEVLKLTTGSIVELDRTIADPVEIIVNDRVIGRGEVVVVEGNYGVRIQQVSGVSPSEFPEC